MVRLRPPQQSFSMPRGQVLLLAAKPWFIRATLLLALLLDFMPLGRLAWWPDPLAIVLAFWSVHQPRRVALGAGFLLGLLLDVQSHGLLGQHALAYTVLTYGAIAMQRRLLWFSLRQQALHVLPLFIVLTLLEFGVRMAAGTTPPGWSLALAPALQAALWPLLSALLLLPQRRAPDADANRPL